MRAGIGSALTADFHFPALVTMADSTPPVARGSLHMRHLAPASHIAGKTRGAEIPRPFRPAQHQRRMLAA